MDATEREIECNYPIAGLARRGAEEGAEKSDLALRDSLGIVRIGEEQLVAVRVFDNHGVVAPPAIPDRCAPVLEFDPERLQRRQVDRDEDAAAPGLFGLLAVEEDFAILAVDLTDKNLSVLRVAVAFDEAEFF